MQHHLDTTEKALPIEQLARNLRTACATFTTGNWAHVTSKLTAYIGEPGLARMVTGFMLETCGGKELYTPIYGQDTTAMGRRTFGKLRRGKLIADKPGTVPGNRAVRVHWGLVATIVGKVEARAVLGDGFGMKAI